MHAIDLVQLVPGELLQQSGADARLHLWQPCMPAASSMGRARRKSDTEILRPASRPAALCRYETGKYLQKQNTFTDFVACAELLVQRQYTSPARLCIEGRSAGGLTMGAAINLRPDLFNAAILGVPFVDALTTMLDETIPLTSATAPSFVLLSSAFLLLCPNSRAQSVQTSRPRSGGTPRRRCTTTA